MSPLHKRRIQVALDAAAAKEQAEKAAKEPKAEKQGKKGKKEKKAEAETEKVVAVEK